MGIFKLKNPSKIKGSQINHSNYKLNHIQKQENNQKIKFLIFEIIFLRNSVKNFKGKKIRAFKYS